MAAWDRFYTPLTQWMSAAGVPMALAELYFFESGSTTAPLATYSNAALSSANAHPVVADADGVFGPIFLQELPYNVVFVAAGGDVNDPVWSTDPVQPFTDSSVTTSYYDTMIYIPSKPDAGLVYPIANIARSLRLPADLDGSVFTIATLPTATFTITIKKNASSIGTIAFSTAGAPTITFLTDVDFSAGDNFNLTFPGSQDATGAAISLTFVFTVL